MNLYPSSMAEHGPCRSLAAYLAELVERRDALPQGDRRYPELVERIRQVEAALNAELAP